MTRSIILSLLLTVAVFIGLLLLFPAIWVAAIFVLLMLATAQVVLVRRHLRVLAPWERGEDPPVPPGIGPPQEAGTAAPAGAKPGSGAPAQPIASDAFNRFRAQLESAEQSVPPAAGARAAATTPTTPEQVQDRVQLSSGARKRSVNLQALRTPHPAERDNPDEDIFSDLRTDPDKLTAPDPAAPAARRPSAAPQGDLLDVLDAPAAGAAIEDSSTLLKLIEEALVRRDLDGARAGLQNYFAAVGAAPDATDWRAHRSAMHLAALEHKPAKVTEAFELMLKAGYALAEQPFEALLDELLGGMPPGDAGPLRVSLLVRALAVFRQRNDRPAMDRLYRRIEEVQAGIGDEEKLVRFLKNHLEIKKVMQDLAGQLDIVDQIGNRLYRMGHTDEAREYYEQGLKLRAELEAQEVDDDEAAGTEAAAPAEKSDDAPALDDTAQPGGDALAEDVPPDEPRQRRGE